MEDHGSSVAKADSGDAKSSGQGSDGLAALARELSPTQRRFVMAGTFHGDFTMATVRALRRKGLFYHALTSPNGRCGPMLLTPLGHAVQATLTKAVRP